MHETVIRGGTVVDGSGAPATRADVAIDGGIITAISNDVGPGDVEVDADGCIVTPGFVDPHTHLDAQLFWAPSGAPSANHGITTVNLSSCGFGLAPLADGGGDTLLRALEVVEEIPYEATSRVVPFDWSTWSEYFDSLARLPLGVNVTGFVPHSALRYAAMGDRAFEEVADEADRQRMCALLSDALAAGAIGLSSSRGPNHVDHLGRPMPSRLADEIEIRQLIALCRGRVWQVNLENKLGGDVSAINAEVDGFAAWARDAGVLLSWTPFLAQSGRDSWREVLHHNHELGQKGFVVRPQVCPQPISIAISFRGGCVQLHSVNGWEEAFRGYEGDDDAARHARLQGSPFRELVRRAGTSGEGLLAPRFEAWSIAASRTRPELTGVPLAEAFTGPSPVDELFDLVLADGLETVIQVPVANDDPVAAAELVSDSTTLIGLGDAGAHVNSITNYSYTTYMLTEMVRDGGVMTLEAAVRALTSIPASFLSLAGRGTLAEGFAADVCVIDLAGLSLANAEIVHDLPGGHPRLDRGARGYEAVFVNGVRTIDHDELTGEGPGAFAAAVPGAGPGTSTPEGGC